MYISSSIGFSNLGMELFHFASCLNRAASVASANMSRRLAWRAKCGSYCLCEQMAGRICDEIDFRSLFLVAVSATGSHASSWEGEYAGSCGSSGKFQCDLELKDVRKGKVEASLTIAAHADSTDIKCRIQGTFIPAGHALQGQFTQSDRKITISESSSGVLLRGIDGKTNACGTDLDGEFDIMGE